MTTVAAANREARKYGFTIRRNPNTKLFEMKVYGGAYCWHQPLIYRDLQTAVDAARALGRKQ